MNGNNATEFNLTQHTPESIIKIAVLGAESTGKTTLCRDLAEHFNTLWVIEYMRPYLQHKWNFKQATCTWEDLLPIAQGQISHENELAKQLEQRSKLAKNDKKYLFCDTTLFELMIYANWYYGDCPAKISQSALSHHYDLILVTAVDMPWVADDLRDSPYDREAITTRIEHELNYYNKTFKWVSGSRESRVQQVAKLLSDL